MNLENFRNKRLLILGGISHMVDVVITAKKMGVFTIVVDYDRNSPAKKVSDKSYNASTTDIDALEKIAKKENIDGVFTAFEDTNTYTALELCQRMGLPFYANKSQLDQTSDKEKFKELCIKFNVPIVETYLFTDNFIDKIDSGAVKLPIIVKPVDSYGSKGITVCEKFEDFNIAVEHAEKYSKTKTVTIENFYRGHGVEIYYTIQNKKIYLTAMSDRFVYQPEKQAPPLPIATVFPSKYLNTYCETIDNNVREMISSLNIKNGVVCLQAVLEESNIYIYEMAFRLTGEKHYQIVKKNANINLLEMMIQLALFDEFNLYDLNLSLNTTMKYPSCNLSYLVKKGKIKTVQGFNELLKISEVIDFIQLLKEGEEVKQLGDYNQMLGRINIVAKDKKNLNRVIQVINNLISVEGTNGEQMLISPFNQKI